MRVERPRSHESKVQNIFEDISTMYEQHDTKWLHSNCLRTVRQEQTFAREKQFRSVERRLPTSACALEAKNEKNFQLGDWKIAWNACKVCGHFQMFAPGIIVAQYCSTLVQKVCKDEQDLLAARFASIATIFALLSAPNARKERRTRRSQILVSYRLPRIAIELQ